jgi:4-amino-4-deoxy-L-arabinose transferase-like glycosyltransferase
MSIVACVHSVFLRLRPSGQHLGLLVILVAFILLGCFYSVATPIFEASDEMWHYPVVKHIADGRGLPVQDPNVRTKWHQEGSQPPLYYAISALLTRWIDTDDLDEVLRYNPHTTAGYALLKGSKNMVIHTQREAFPYRRTALAVHLIRLFSVLLGAGTVTLTYATALAIPDTSRVLALAAAGLTAFNPMFLFISGSVNNDNLAALLGAAGLLLLCLIVKEGTTWRCLALLSLVLGLGALTKLSLLGLLPLTALVLIHVQIAVRDCSSLPPRKRIYTLLWQGAFLLVVVLALAGWWYARNWRLYGEPLGLNMMLEFAGRRGPGFTLADLIAEFQGFRISYWALFGGVNILADEFIYRLLDALWLIAAAGWLLALGLSLWRRQRVRAVMLAVIMSWALIVFAALIRWTMLTAASQGRLVFSAISAFSVSTAVGLEAILPGGLRRPAFATLVGALALFAIVSPFRYIMPAYARPPVLQVGDIPQGAQRADLNYNGQMRLLAYNPLGHQTVHPGEEATLTVYWQSLRPMEKDYSVFVHLLARPRQVVGQFDTYPGLGSYPTSMWKQGDIIADTYHIPVVYEGEAPILAQVDVGLYDYHSSRQGLPAHDSQGRAASTILGAVKVAPWREPVYTYTHPVSYTLGQQITLVGYDLTGNGSQQGQSEPLAVRPGEVLEVTLYWQTVRQPDKDYQVLVHLLTADGEIAAQGDGPPAEGTYPTSWWEAGEVVKDQHTVSVPARAMSGPYRLATGLYELSSGVRLSVAGPGEQIADDRILLTTIWVR